MELRDINIKSSSDHANSMMVDLNLFYKNNSFCDASIVCSDGVAVKCHKLVLAALSDMLSKAMHNQLEEEPTVILLPDLNSQTLIQGLDAVYNCQSSAISPRQHKHFRLVCEALSSQVWQDLFGQWQPKMEDADQASNHVLNKCVKNPSRKRRNSLYGSYHERSKAKIKRESDLSDPVVLDHSSCHHLDEMFERRSGTWIVRVDKESVQIPSFSTSSVRYMALMGVKRSISGDFDAMPLAWSCPSLLSDSAIVRQLKSYGSAVKSVFGLSDLEIYGQLKVRHLMAMPKTAQNRTEISCTSSAKLKEVLNEDEMQIASQTGTSKDNLHMFLNNKTEDLALKIVDEMEHSQIEGVLLVLLDSNEQAIAYVLNPLINPDSARDERDDASRDLFKLFFTVFLLRTKANCYEGCQQLMDHYRHYAWLKRRHDRAVDILSGDKVLVSRAEKVCEDCGKSFVVKDKASKSYYERHRKEHYFENYKCGCHVSWTNSKEKRNHVMLAHMQGYVKCPHCDHVTVESAMAGHVANVHSKMTCEYCGVVITNKYGLREHVTRLHPEKVPKRTLRKQLQGVTGMCPQCGIYFKDLKKHTFLQHRGGNKLMPCDVCGRDIKRSAMKGHVLHMHTPESELPHPCNRCHRRFSTNHFLKRHIQAIHDKLLLFACQFEGCNVAYSHDATLSKHQRMRHKITYNEAVRKGLAEPKTKEQALLEHQRAQNA